MTKLRELTVPDFWLGGLLNPSCLELNRLFTSLNTVHVELGSSDAPRLDDRPPLRSLGAALKRRRKHGCDLIRFNVSGPKKLTEKSVALLQSLDNIQGIELDR